MIMRKFNPCRDRSISLRVKFGDILIGRYFTPNRLRVREIIDDYA